VVGNSEPSPLAELGVCSTPHLLCTLTCLPPHPGPAAAVVLRPACELGLCPGMGQWVEAAVVVLRGAQKFSRILSVAQKALRRAEYPGGPEGSRW
jgi:hypothetical protein